MARSAKPSLLKSPTPRAEPKPSSVSAPPSTPGVFWEKNWLPLADSPLAEPYRTLTAPASVIVPMSSPGTPMARSINPSLSKSPAARALPNKSNGSAASATPPPPWTKSWLPAPDSPLADPSRTFTAPASSAVPTPSRGTPTARSAKPSLSKSASTDTAAAAAAGEGLGGGPAFGLGSGGAGDHRPARQCGHHSEDGQDSTHAHHPRPPLCRGVPYGFSVDGARGRDWTLREEKSRPHAS